MLDFRVGLLIRFSSVNNSSTLELQNGQQGDYSHSKLLNSLEKKKAKKKKMGK